jgi:hypothetical protein
MNAMASPLYYVGTREEVAHHARPLADAFDLRVVSVDEVRRFAQAGDVCVFFNEHFPRFRDACLDVKAKQCATLYAFDGILEWRNSWEMPDPPPCCLWAMRPVLCDKVVCIGRSQARIFESWGNLGKCEIVGVPRFDCLAGRRPRDRRPGESFRILVVTAKCPGFTPAQIERTTQSLRDLKDWFAAHPQVGDMPLEPVWRITQGLEQVIGVENRLADTTGKDLASVLREVDAVITTPSTVMLEAMLQRVPVALLDYPNRPHYVPAAWSVTAQKHLDEVIPQLLASTPAQMLYQDSILHDALECHTPATPRLVQLIAEMSRLARQCLDAGQPLSFPRRILSDPQDGHHLPEPNYDHSSLFPAHLLATGAGRLLTFAEAMALVQREGFSLPAAQRAADHTISSDDLWLSRYQSPRRDWREVREIAAEVEAEKQRATAALRRELRLAHQEIKLLERQTLEARLNRLRNKVRRLLRLPPSSQRPQARDKAA